MENLSKLKKLDGNVLKLIACISMLIDHIAAGIMLPVVNNGYYTGSLSIEQLNKLYIFLREAGRSAFPIFCFLLVEGFVHTKSRLRYALSLLLFGLISEIPFDLVFFVRKNFSLNIIETLKDNSHLLLGQCNVYFTLLIGLLVIWAIDRISNLLAEKGIPIGISLFPAPVFIALGCYLAYKINTDYDIHGIILISAFYLFRNYRYIALIGGYLYISQLPLESASFPGFILMLLYSNKRGRNLGNLKYLFYFFYPVHLICIYIIRCLLCR